jgi:hypothetical protein
MAAAEAAGPLDDWDRWLTAKFWHEVTRNAPAEVDFTPQHLPLRLMALVEMQRRVMLGVYADDLDPPTSGGVLLG